MVLAGWVADLLSARAAFLLAAGITFGGMTAVYFIAPRRTAAPSTDGARPRPAARGVMRELFQCGSLWIVCIFNFIVFFSISSALGAISRFGPAPALTAVAAAMLVTASLSVALSRRERAAYASVA